MITLYRFHDIDGHLLYVGIEAVGEQPLAELHREPAEWEAIEDLTLGGWIELCVDDAGNRTVQSTIPYRQGRPIKSAA